MYLKLAWRNIWRNRKRTWITASSISFGVFFAVLMQSMQLGSYQKMIDNSVRFLTGHLAIHQEEYWDEQILDNGFSQDLIAELTLDKNSVDVAVPRINSFALASFKDKTKGVLISGIDPEKEAQLTLLDNKITSGDYLTGKGAVIGEGLASYLKVSVGDTLVLISQGYHGVNAAGKFFIEGLLKFPVPELNQSAVYLSLEDAQHFFGAPGIITSYSLLLQDESDVPKVQSVLQTQVNNKNLSVMNWKEMMPELIEGIELDYYGGLIMVYILYAVIGFGIFGTFLMMTKERTYEFGVMISIGMKKLKIQTMVAFEILMLTFLGVTVGLLAATPLTLYFHLNPIEFSGEAAQAYENFGYEPIIPFALESSVYINQGIAILLIAIFLGIYPMIAIKSLNITKALKE